MATQSDNTNTGVVTTIVVVGTFAMISISAMLTALVRSEHNKLDSERPTNADLDTVAALDEKQLAALNAAPSWVSQPGGKVAIPIQRAMSVVVDEYKQHPEAASPPAPPGVNMTPPVATAGQAPGAAPPGAAPPGAVPAAPGQPVPATPTVATPNAAAPNPATTQQVVPPPAAPGPPATPATGPGTPPTTPAPPAGGH
ncbi:MAG TPA: hypothetical protein VMG12_05805 [Polyangiaceae bacterium]|nr:hypothetical protein [Polyangiaceae bacterium]